MTVEGYEDRQRRCMALADRYRAAGRHAEANHWLGQAIRYAVLRRLAA